MTVWGQELDEEDGVEDEDTFMACQVQVFEADEVEWEAIDVRRLGRRTQLTHYSCPNTQ